MPAMSKFKMPEPIGTYDVTHIGPFRSRTIDVTETSLAEGKYDIFTADQLRQAVIDALEMAAQLCDNKNGTLGAKYQGDVYAEAIRALKEQIK